MFSRRNRIPRAAFPAALSRGKRLSTAHFLVVCPAEGLGYAVVVPKKIARRAIDRHRLKRRVFAALRSLSPLPASLIVFPRASSSLLGYDEVRAELEELISRIPKR